MNDLERRLASLRRRIRAGRAAEAAARGAFYASLAACALLAASRIGGLAVPGAVAWGAIAAVALTLALREAARSFTIRHCAIHLAAGDFHAALAKLAQQHAFSATDLEDFLDLIRLVFQ